MNRNYEATENAYIDNYNLPAQAKVQAAARAQSALGSGSAQTELDSLLSTLRNQACEIRICVAQICSRVVLQCADDCAEKQAFNGGYIGQAEEIRSIQSEVIRMLAELSKYA